MIHNESTKSVDCKEVGLLEKQKVGFIVDTDLKPQVVVEEKLTSVISELVNLDDAEDEAKVMGRILLQ